MKRYAAISKDVSKYMVSVIHIDAEGVYSHTEIIQRNISKPKAQTVAERYNINLKKHNLLHESSNI